MNPKRPLRPADHPDITGESEKTPGKAEGERDAIEQEPPAPASTPGKAEGEREEQEEAVL